MDLINWFLNELKTNNILTALLASSSLGAITWIGYKILHFIKIKTTVVLHLDSGNQVGYLALNEFIREYFTIDNYSAISLIELWDSNLGRYTHVIMPVFGSHYFIKDFKLFLLERYRIERVSYDHVESTTISVIGFNCVKFKNILLDKLHPEINEDKIPIKIRLKDDWVIKYKNKRYLNTIYNIDITSIIKTIQTFQNSKEWYYSRGLNYKLNLLFHGLPGCGKTSAILALASECKLTIIYINLSTITSDTNLIEILSGIKGDKNLIVIEDIDANNINLNRINENNNSKSTSITIGGLLNILDGLLTPEGNIFVLTTNHLHKLDSALIRPGRIDYQYEFTELTYNNAKHWLIDWYPKISDPDIFLKECNFPMTPAKFQEYLLTIKN